MFERTALPAGPRVISARLPAARSVSIAAYVLAGSRLEVAGQVGVAHFMEHITFKGTTAYPSTRAISEAIEGVGGSFNAATDRESTVYWVRVPLREAERAMDVVGELIVRPRLEAADIQSERAVIIEEIRSYLDDPSEYCQMLFQTAMFGDGPLGREICGEESDILALPEAAVHDFWRTPIARPTRSSRSSATSATRPRPSSPRRRSGAATGRSPGSPRRRPCPPVRGSGPGKRDTSQAQLCLGVPALHRDHPDSWTLAVLNAVLGDGMSSRLFLSVREELGLAYDVSSGLVDYADAGALEVSAGVDPAGLPAALDAILVELARLRDEPVPEQELGKAKRYLSGGLELRMDDTRHVASWIGGQEALHDRVLTLDEALAAVEAVGCRRDPGARRHDLPRRRAAAGGRRARALPARTRGQAPDARMTAPTMVAPAERAPTQARAIELVLAHMHLRLASLALARVELETLAGLGGLDTQGLVDLAEVRWRTGDLVGAGEAAAAALRADDVRPDPIALVVAAEAASAIGRPSEARRLATRATAAAPHSIDEIFAGMPRSGVWVPDANEPLPTAPTLFDRGPESPAAPERPAAPAAPASTDRAAVAQAERDDAPRPGR